MIIKDFGTACRFENFDIGQNGIGIRSQARQHTGFRAGGYQNVLRFEHLSALVGLDLDFTRSFDDTESFNPFNFVFLHQEFNAFGVFPDNAVFALDYLRKIELRLIDRDAFLPGMRGEIPHIRGMQQRLGGNASHMKASAAQFCIFLDNGRFQAVLSGADGSRVAAGAASNHYKVVGHATSF